MLSIGFARSSLCMAALAILPSTLGCAMESGSEDANNAEKAEATSAALTSYAYYYWDQYQGHVTVMWPISQGVCYLTGMGGYFNGTGENVHIEVDNGYWVLTGESHQNSVHSTASCVSWADLGANGGYGFQTWAVQSYGGDSCPWPLACGSSGTYGSTEMWNGFNFCSLSYISGNFVNQTDVSSWFDGNNWFMSTYEDTRQSWSLGKSLCFGLKLPHYLAQAGSQWWYGGQNPVYLAQADQAMCALAEVKGNFRGSGEHVQIENLNGAWYLTGSTQQPNTAARAACLWLHQH